MARLSSQAKLFEYAPRIPVAHCASSISLNMLAKVPIVWPTMSPIRETQGAKIIIHITNRSICWYVESLLDYEYTFLIVEKFLILN